MTNQTPESVIAEAIEYHADTIGFHWDGCYKHHAVCLAVKLRDMLREPGDAALAAIERVRALETFSITDSYPAWTAVDHDDLLAALDGAPEPEVKPSSTVDEGKLDALNELFLHMRDRVMGYVSAPPVSRVFTDGGYAFEWAAGQVRRARDGEKLLSPPMPEEIRQMRKQMAEELDETTVEAIGGEKR